MTREAITPLNYTSSAIDDLRELERNCLYEAPYSANVLRNVITLLENSVKFILRKLRCFYCSRRPAADASGSGSFALSCGDV
ncbi:hypothetical protein BHG93_21690 [Salmonella enterica]|nr:hypothetical protein [Salmonella enterica]